VKIKTYERVITMMNILGEKKITLEVLINVLKTYENCFSLLKITFLQKFRENARKFLQKTKIKFLRKCQNKNCRPNPKDTVLQIYLMKIRKKYSRTLPPPLPLPLKSNYWFC